jgi:hypothetical protein
MGESLKNFTYNNKEIADEIYAAVNSTQFLGVSVRKTATQVFHFFIALIFNAKIFRRDASRSVRRVTGLLSRKSSR